LLALAPLVIPHPAAACQPNKPWKRQQHHPLNAFVSPQTHKCSHHITTTTLPHQDS